MKQFFHKFPESAENITKNCTRDGFIFRERLPCCTLAVPDTMLRSIIIAHLSRESYLFMEFIQIFFSFFVYFMKFVYIWYFFPFKFKMEGILPFCFPGNLRLGTGRLSPASCGNSTEPLFDGNSQDEIFLISMLLLALGLCYTRGRNGIWKIRKHSTQSKDIQPAAMPLKICGNQKNTLPRNSHFSD